MRTKKQPFRLLLVLSVLLSACQASSPILNATATASAWSTLTGQDMPTPTPDTLINGMDSRFADAGLWTYEPPEGTPLSSLILDNPSDDQILFVGTTANPASVIVTQLLDSGVPDRAFNNGEIHRLPTNYARPVVSAVVRMHMIPERYAVVWDQATDDGTVTVIRLLPDGMLDPSFGNGLGQVVIDAQLDEVIQAEYQWPEGMVILGRRNNELLLLRVTPEGALDETYGEGGIVNTHLLPQEINAASLIVTTGGHALVTGISPESGQPEMGMWNEAGNQNMVSFVGGFIELSDMQGALAAYTSRDLLVMGMHNGNLVIAAYQSNGYPSATFGVDGQVVIDLEEAIQIHKVVVRGHSLLFAIGYLGSNPAIFRITNEDGSLNTEFHTGYLTWSDGEESQITDLELSSPTILPGWMYLAGHSPSADGRSIQFFIARFLGEYKP